MRLCGNDAKKKNDKGYNKKQITVHNHLPYDFNRSNGIHRNRILYDRNVYRF